MVVYQQSRIYVYFQTIAPSGANAFAAGVSLNVNNDIFNSNSLFLGSLSSTANTGREVLTVLGFTPNTLLNEL